MKPERWRQIDQIYHSTLEREEGQRASFLKEACAGDEVLRREVESLLARKDEAESFIEVSALEAAAKGLAEGPPQSLVGRQIGSYQILSLLGAGGMGEVYRARDTKLDRIDALKVLPAEVASDQDRMRRFIREAQAASALKHPNVATIYEIGASDDFNFIAMEFVEGQTLAARISGRPLPIAEIVDIGIQVADALDEAHRKGITHRDIKPGNLMVTPRGQVKVLDFGLAKVTRPEGQAMGSDIRTVVNTATGVVMGTVPYMSPEQILGRKVDHRTDIFSLGVVLYEMATGQLPFSGSSVGQTTDRILHGQPDAIARFNYNVPAELDRIIRKCLEKDGDARYQSAHELLIDLKNLKRDSDLGSSPAERATPEQHRRMRRLTVAALGVGILLICLVGFSFLAGRGTRREGSIDSVAILPLLNRSEDPNAEYLSDGITESLINSLSQLPRLRVMARTTVFRYKGQGVDPQKVGRELGVRAVLTGRVLQRGDTLNIQADLVDVADGSQLWGEQYNRKLADILVVQEEISREISEKLQLRLSGEEKKQLAKRHTQNTEAYQFYLKGLYHWNKRTEDGLKKGVEYLQQAVERDANYALAYAMLSDCYYLLGSYLPPKETRPLARMAAVRARELDDTLAEAHLALAGDKFYSEWDWVGAEKEYQRAIDLNAGFATAHQRYSFYLMSKGRTEESLAEIKRAQQLDPVSLTINTSLGWRLYFARRYDQAIGQYRKTLEMDPNFAQAHLRLGEAYEQKGMYAEAIAEFQKVRQLDDSPQVSAALGQALAMSGKRGEAQKVLDELKELSKQRYVSPYHVALIYAGLGDKNQGLEWLRKAYEDGSFQMAVIKVEPRFDSLRSDPRFSDLVRRIGLTP